MEEERLVRDRLACKLEICRLGEVAGRQVVLAGKLELGGK